MEKSADSVLVLFDFDKTLIRKDSFRFFSLFSSTSVWRKAQVFFLAVWCKLGVISNEAYKASVLELVWVNREEHEKELLIDNFCAHLRKNEIQEVVARLHNHISSGHVVAVLSASPEFYLLPYLSRLAPEVKGYGSKYTREKGAVIVENLYGEKKVVRARQLLSEFQPDSVFVYTDHESDIGLVELSTQAVLVSPSARFVRSVKSTAVPFEVLSS